MPTVTRSYRWHRFDQLAPRFGFAWSPGGSDKTVVRAASVSSTMPCRPFVADDFMTNLPNESMTVVLCNGVPSVGRSIDPTAPTARRAARRRPFSTGFANGVSCDSIVSVA